MQVLAEHGIMGGVSNGAIGGTVNEEDRLTHISRGEGVLRRYLLVS